MSTHAEPAHDAGHVNIVNTDAVLSKWTKQDLSGGSLASAEYKPPIHESFQKQVESPIDFARQEQLNSPEVSELTKNICADVMTHQVKAILSMDRDIINRNPSLARYKNLLADFEDAYAHDNHGHTFAEIAGNDKEIHKFFKKLLTKDKYQALGIKMAEDWQSVLQATTGVHVYLDAEFEPREYISEQVAVTSENNEMDEHGNEKLRSLGDVDHTRIRKKGFWGRLLNKIVLDRSSDRAAEMGDITDEMLEEEGRKRLQNILSIEFEIDPRLHTNVNVLGRPLDSVQEAMIRQMKFLGNIPKDDLIEGHAQEDVIRQMRRISKARMNFYAHHNRYLSEEADFNMDKYSGPSEHPSILLDNFGIPRANGQSREIAVGAGQFGLEFQIDTLRTGIREEMDHALKEDDIKTTQKIIEGQIERLAPVAAVKRDPNRAKEIDEKDLVEWNEKRTLLEKRTALEGEEKEAQGKIQFIDDELKKDSPVQDATGTRFLTWQELYDQYRVEENELTKKQRELTTLQAQYSTIKGLYDQIEATIAGTPANKTNAAAIDLLIKRADKYEDQLTNPTTGLGVKISQATQAQSNQESKVKTAKSQTTQDVIDRVADRATYKANEEEARKKRRSLEIEIGKKLEKTAASGTTAAVEFTETDIKKRIQDLEAERDVSNSTDRFAGRKLEAYKQLKEKLSPEELKRTEWRSLRPWNSREVKQAMDNAQISYPEYPPAYLYMLQVVYGNEVTLLTPDQRNVFQKATSLLTPDLFVEMVNKGLPQGTTAYGNFEATMNIPIEKVNGNLISNTFEELMKRAKAGTLGETSAADKSAIAIIEKTSANKMKDIRKDHEDNVNAGVAEYQAHVPAIEINRHLQRLSNIDAAKIPIYRAEVVAFKITDKFSLNDAALKLMDKHKTPPDVLSETQAEQIVGTVYGLFNKAERANEMMTVATNQNLSMDQSITLAASEMMINDIDEQVAFMAMVEKGMNPEQIYDQLNALPQANKPKYFPYFKRLHDKIVQLGPNYSYQDLMNEISKVWIVQKRVELGAQAVGSIAVQDELASMKLLLEAFDQRQAVEVQIRNLTQRGPVHYENVEDLTLQLMKSMNYSYMDKDKVAYVKGLATQINAERKAQGRA